MTAVPWRVSIGLATALGAVALAVPYAAAGAAQSWPPTVAAGPSRQLAVGTAERGLQAATTASASPVPATPRPPVRHDGVISGRIRNGTAGSNSVTGAKVVVVPFAQTGSTTGISTTAGADGTYRVTGLAAGPDNSYGVGAIYQGAEYLYPDAVPLTGDAPTRQGIDFSVYEADAKATVDMRTGHVVLMPAAAEGVLHVAEAWVIRNQTDRTRVVGNSGAVLRLPLLSGARQVEVQDPHLQSVSSIEGDTFIDGAAIPPGEQQVVVLYDVPYASSAYTLTRNLVLPTEQFRLLVVASDAAVASTVLTATERSTIGGEPVLAATGTNLAAGTRVQVRITGLPPSQVSTEAAVMPLPAPVVPAEVLAMTALIVTLAGTGLAIAYARPTTRNMARREARLAAGREQVVRDLAALERQRAEGAIRADAYAQRRSRLMAQALALSAAQPLREQMRPRSD
jgi:hypothetical protein